MADAYTLSVLLNAKDNLSPTIDRVDGRMNRLASNISKHRRAIGIAAVGIGTAVGAGLGVAVKHASTLEESINAVNVVFGKGSDVIHEFGKTVAQEAGLSTAKFNQLSSQVGALLMDVGLPMTEVADLVTQLTVRSADMASVMDTDVTDALSAVNQALRGETEAIRRYTGDVTDASLEQFRLAEGMAKPVAQMNEQEKRLLRLSLLLEQTNKFAGDFANTSDSLANAMRRNKAEAENLSAQIGMALLPAIAEMANAIGPLLEGIGDWVKENPELTRTIVKVGAVAAGAAIAIGGILLILPGLAIALGFLTVQFGSLTLAMGPISAIILAIVAAVMLAIEVYKNWDKIVAFFSRNFAAMGKVVITWVTNTLKGFQNIIKALATFIPGLDKVEKKLDAGIKKLEQSTLKLDEWAESHQIGAIDVAQAMGSAEDDWEDMADTVEHESASVIRNQEAIIDSNSDVQRSVENTADTFKKGAVTTSRVSEENVRFARMVADNWEETSRRMNDSFEDMDDGYSVTLRNMQKREEQFTASRKYFSDLRIEVEKKERETQREIWQQKAKDMQEAQRKMEEDQKRQTERLTENWARVGEAFDETLINWKRSGADTADVVRLWATRMKISTDDVIGQLIAMNVDTSDVHAVLQAFAEKTGTSFFIEFNKAKDAVKGLGDEMQTLVTAFETLTGEKNPLAGVKLFPSGGEGFDPESTLEQRLEGTMFDAKVKKELNRFDAGSNFADYVEALFEEQGKRNPFGVQSIGTANISAAMTRQNISNVAAKAMNRGENVFDAVIEAADNALTEQVTNAITGGYISAQQAIKEGKITEEQAKTRGLIKEVVKQVEEQVKQETPSPIDFDLEGGFANGGRVKRGGLALVGERGPEIVSLPGGAFVHPNGTGPGGGVTNQFHFHGAVYGVEDLKEVVVEAVRDHAISGGFQGVFQEA